MPLYVIKCGPSFQLFHTCFCRVYWPLFVLIFYILSPIPTFISRRLSDDTDSSSNACRELAYFLTTGIVVSSFGLPIVLARNTTVSSLYPCWNKLVVDFSKHSQHPWLLFFCVDTSAGCTMSYVSIFVLHCILRDAQCASCPFVKANRRLWNYLGQKTDSVSIFFSYRLSGVPAASSWQEMLSSSSPSLAFLLCLEEGTISAGSSGRVPVDSGRREREMDGWMGR